MTLDVWNVLGTWVSGLATLFVGIIAIMTSRTRLKPLLIVNANLGNIIGTDVKEEFIFFSVSDISAFPICINSVYWKFPSSKNYAFQMLSYDDPR